MCPLLLTWNHHKGENISCSAKFKLPSSTLRTIILTKKCMIFQRRSRINFFGEYPEKNSTQQEVKEHIHTYKIDYGLENIYSVILTHKTIMDLSPWHEIFFKKSFVAFLNLILPMNGTPTSHLIWKTIMKQFFISNSRKQSFS